MHICKYFRALFRILLCFRILCEREARFSVTILNLLKLLFVNLKFFYISYYTTSKLSYKTFTIECHAHLNVTVDSSSTRTNISKHKY